MGFAFLTESEIKRSDPLNFKPEKLICLPQCLVSINDLALAGLWLSLSGHTRESFRQPVSKEIAILRLNMKEKYAWVFGVQQRISLLKMWEKNWSCISYTCHTQLLLIKNGTKTTDTLSWIFLCKKSRSFILFLLNINKGPYQLLC